MILILSLSIWLATIGETLAAETTGNISASVVEVITGEPETVPETPLPEEDYAEWRSIAEWTPSDIEPAAGEE